MQASENFVRRLLVYGRNGTEHTLWNIHSLRKEASRKILMLSILISSVCNAKFNARFSKKTNTAIK